MFGAVGFFDVDGIFFQRESYGFVDSRIDPGRIGRSGLFQFDSQIIGLDDIRADFGDSWHWRTNAWPRRRHEHHSRTDHPNVAPRAGLPRAHWTRSPGADGYETNRERQREVLHRRRK